MSNGHSHTIVPLNGDDFHAIADLAYKESGLILVEEKLTMVQSRLRHRLRALGLGGFSEYCTYVQSQSQEGQQERRHLISALTTNVSHFFREDHHFERLRENLSSQYTSTKSIPVRIWSAGCSNGQEPLSIAMTVLEHAPRLADLDLRILATDIDPAVLQYAKRGAYPERSTDGVPNTLKQKYFEQDHHNSVENTYAVKPALRSLIRYNELNLLATWPIKSQFNAIFCRNVVIYFDAVTQEGLWPRFRKALRPDGLFFLGHSERIVNPERFGFECIGPTTYRPLPI